MPEVMDYKALAHLTCVSKAGVAEPKLEIKNLLKNAKRIPSLRVTGTRGEGYTIQER